MKTSACLSGLMTCVHPRVQANSSDCPHVIQMHVAVLCGPHLVYMNISSISYLN